MFKPAVAAAGRRPKQTLPLLMLMLPDSCFYPSDITVPFMSFHKRMWTKLL